MTLPPASKCQMRMYIDGSLMYMDPNEHETAI
jgi:hypothetical protein